MLARALIVVLVVLNLGVALWWATHRDPMAGGEPAPWPDAGVQRLRMVGESETTPAAVADHVAAPAAGSGVCVEVGPVDAPIRAAIAQRFAAGPLRANAAAAPAPRAWRVVLPALADLAAADALSQRLKDAGFADQYVQRTGPEAPSIALGRFATQDAAQRHRDALAAAGFGARVLPLPATLLPSVAFEVRQGVQPAQMRAQLAVPGLQAVDCATLR